MMNGGSIVLFIVSVFFLVGAIYFFGELAKPGVYPPKKVLKKRCIAFIGGAVVFFLLGLLFFSFS